MQHDVGTVIKLNANLLQVDMQLILSTEKGFMNRIYCLPGLCVCILTEAKFTVWHNVSREDLLDYVIMQLRFGYNQ